MVEYSYIVLYIPVYSCISLYIPVYSYTLVLLSLCVSGNAQNKHSTPQNITLTGLQGLMLSWYYISMMALWTVRECESMSVWTWVYVWGCIVNGCVWVCMYVNVSMNEYVWLYTQQTNPYVHFSVFLVFPLSIFCKFQFFVIFLLVCHVLFTLPLV